MSRSDLVPDSSAPGAVTLEADGALIGPFGSGLALLFSERFRFVVGHDSRRVGDRFVAHPLGRALVVGRKCIPWMHHPYVPHAILERAGDRCEWLMVMGTFGPTHPWGDGTEANFPQYGIRKAVRERHAPSWEDGVALELSLFDGDGGHGHERSLADLEWQLRHRPGLVELIPVRPGPIARVQVTAPSGERCGRVRVVWSSGAPPATLIARARFLAKQLTVAPEDHRGAIDVLDAPFGFQRFEDHPLTPRALPNGVAFDAGSLGVTLFFVASGPAGARVWPVDAASRKHASHAPPSSGAVDSPASPESARSAASSAFCRPAASFMSAGPRIPALCFDVEMRIGRGSADRTTDLAFGVEDDCDETRTDETALRAPIRASGDDLEGRDGRGALTLRTGDRSLDALLRWSRNVAHSLVAPNGVVMTGSLGYSAKSHVGQDVPFVLPLLLLDPHPRLRAAARRMLEYVVTSPSAADGRGILDHPCEGQDFAFLPMRPRTARVFRRIGAAGLFRWILVVEKLLATSGDRDLARRAFDLFAAKVETHYLPFSLQNECWSAGEETQELAYSLPTAHDGLGALLRLADALDPTRAARLRAPIEAARAAIRAQIEKPVEEGGLRLAAPRARGGVTLDEGWIVQRWVLERDPPWFGFDLPLIAAHALVHDALSAAPRERLADLLADPRGDFRVPGAGLAKSPGGEKGVWFWHDSLAAKGLARAGRLDAAHDLFVAIARGIADMNGLGVPGEETNGGDYAMAIGALAGLSLVEVLLGLEVRGERVLLRPVLPSALDGFVLDGLTIRDRRFGVVVSRARPGPLQASQPIEITASTSATIEVVLR